MHCLGTNCQYLQNHETGEWLHCAFKTQVHQRLIVIKFKVTLPEWSGRECRRLKSVQLEGPLLADNGEKEY